MEVYVKLIFDVVTKNLAFEESQGLPENWNKYGHCEEPRIPALPEAGATWQSHCTTTRPLNEMRSPRSSAPH